MRRSPVRRGLTAIEVAVGLGALLLLLGLLIPVVSGVRESARKSQCQDHLQSLAIMVQNYESGHRVFPPGWVEQEQHAANWSWGAFGLPYLLSSPMYDAVDVGGPSSLAESVDVPSRLVWLQAGEVPFACPADGIGRWNPDRRILSRSGRLTSIALTNYVGVHGFYWTGDAPPEGCFGQNSRVRPADVTDGLANTLQFGERSSRLPRAGDWMDTASTKARCAAALAWGVSVAESGFQEDDELGIGGGGVNGRIDGRLDVAEARCQQGFASHHAGGAQVALAHGKVVLVSVAIEETVLRALCDRSCSPPIIVP